MTSLHRASRRPHKPSSDSTIHHDPSSSRLFPSDPSPGKLPTSNVDPSRMASPSSPSSATYYPSFSPQPPQPPKRSQRYLAHLLKPILLPIILVGLPLWPILAAACAIPIIGVMAIPLLILLSVGLLYAIAWLAYLFLAQPDLPAAWSTTRRWSIKNIAPFLPLSPLRCAKVDLAALRYAITAVRIAIPAVFDWSYRRVMILGTQKGARMVKEGILYGSPNAGKRLDIYIPPASPPASASGGLDEAAIRAERERAERQAGQGRDPSTTSPEPMPTAGSSAPRGAGATGPSSPTGAPVIVVVPSVFAPLSVTSKRKLYLQLALRLRRMGYCVVVPDVTYYPESRIKSSVIDLRLVLRWTARNCQRYGGDPTKIHVMGHGLSAHLVMLTVAQEAVVLSREGHLDRAYERQRELERWRENPYDDGNRHGDAGFDSSAVVEDEDEWKKSGEMGSPTRRAAPTSQGGGSGATKDDVALGEDDVHPVQMQDSERPEPTAGGGDAWVDDVSGAPASSGSGAPPGAVMGGTRRFSPTARRPNLSGNSDARASTTRHPSHRRASPSAQILSSPAYLAASSEVGNGLKRVSIYEPEIEIPPLAGILLFSGISDVIKGFRSESESGLEHLSSLRRATGPSHIQCLLHSPAHLLYAAKNILDTRLLPPKVLLVHGGKDKVVPVEQSTLLKTLLVGVGVENARLRAYRHLGHAESLACLFLGIGNANSRYTRQILDDVAAFVGQ